jgi:hypothetical protein
MRRRGLAWIAVCLALALHVADEAANDFLSTYNATVESVRRTVSWLPLPVFTFEIWIGGLVAAIAILLSLSPYAFRGVNWARPACFVLGGLMFMNAAAHMASSVYFGRWMPGVFSSPVLLGCSAWLILATHRAQRAQPL